MCVPMKKFISLILFILLSAQMFAEETKIEQSRDDWKINALVQMIGQMDGKDFSNTTHPLFYNTLKIRVGVEKTLFENLKFRACVQDSRIFGDQKGITNNTHNLDLFEGYLEFQKLFDTPLSLQAGRFQMSYGTERFIGKSFWHMNERVFDGLRLKYHTEKVKVDYFHIIQHNRTDYLLKVITDNYQYPLADATGKGIYGLWSTINVIDNHQFDLFGFMEADDVFDANVNTEMIRNTAGINYKGNAGIIDWILEYGIQFGTMKTENLVDNKIASTVEKDINAYLATAKLNANLESLSIYAGGNIISGTDPSSDGSEINTYSNYLGSKHKYFGFMDYFSVITKGTANLGLQDIYLGLNYPEIMKNLSADLTLHNFSSNQEHISGETAFGNEVDLTFAYKFNKKTVVKFGGAVFMPDELSKIIWKTGDIIREDTSFWAFIMVVAKL